MNIRQQAVMMIDGVYSVGVRFLEPLTREGLSAKTYAYKTTEYFEVGDHAVVMSPSGLAIVKVVEIHSGVRFYEEGILKWIISKVDIEGYNAQIEREAAFIEVIEERLAAKEQESIRNELMTVCGMDEDEFAAEVDALNSPFDYDADESELIAGEDYPFEEETKEL